MNKVIEATTELKKLHADVIKYKSKLIDPLFDEMSKKYPEFATIRERDLKSTEFGMDIKKQFFLTITTRDGRIININIKKDYLTMVTLCATFAISKECNTGLAHCTELIMPQLEPYNWKLDGETLEITVEGRKSANVFEEIFNL